MCEQKRLGQEEVGACVYPKGANSMAVSGSRLWLALGGLFLSSYA